MLALIRMLILQYVATRQRAEKIPDFARSDHGLRSCNALFSRFKTPDLRWSKFRTIHHHAPTALLASANHFAFLRHGDRAADRTDYFTHIRGLCWPFNFS
jgi:hypothetical protein